MRPIAAISVTMLSHFVFCPSINLNARSLIKKFTIFHINNYHSITKPNTENYKAMPYMGLKQSSLIVH
jgi:hypothetical protein